MTKVYIPVNDKGFNLNFTVKDATGTAYNLTDYTIKLKVWKVSNPGTLLVTGTCVIVIAANGTCYYNVAASDFTSIGSFKAELELTKTGVIESTQSFDIEVMESG